jgi:hypothetical protein
LHFWPAAFWQILLFKFDHGRRLNHVWAKVQKMSPVRLYFDWRAISPLSALQYEFAEKMQRLQRLPYLLMGKRKAKL